ncbi:gliding motility-associated C-terminal domain-containing protein, partial [Olleya aquimaris]
AGSCANESVITRTWTLTDECNNTTTLVQTITIVDTTGPTLITPLDLPSSVICSNVPDVPELSFEDDCSTNNITVVFEETSTFTGTEEIYDLIWTWTATDECGNDTVITHTISVVTENFTEEIEADRCTEDGLIDLYEFLPNGADTSIEWVVVTDGITIIDGIFDPLEVEIGDYVFTYTVSNNGCLNTYEVTIHVNEDCIVLPCGEDDLKISKAVTPNGDSYNEYFTVGGVEECGFIVDIKIFNRFGDIVFESRDYQNDWNGQSPSGSVGSAGRLPNGTYYYVIEIKDSGIKPLAGPLYLGTK